MADETNKLINIIEFQEVNADVVPKATKNISILIEEEEKASPVIDKTTQKIREQGDAAVEAAAKVDTLTASRKKAQAAADEAEAKSQAKSATSGGTIGDTGLSYNEMQEVQRIHAEKERMAQADLATVQKINADKQKAEEADLVAIEKIHADKQKLAADEYAAVQKIHTDKEKLANAEFSEIQKIHAVKVAQVEAEASSTAKQAEKDYAAIQKIHAAKEAARVKDAATAAKNDEAESKRLAESYKAHAIYIEQVAAKGLKYGEDVTKSTKTLEDRTKSVSSAITQISTAFTNLGRSASRVGGDVEAIGGPLQAVGYGGLAAARGIGAFIGLAPEIIAVAGALAAVGAAAATLALLNAAAFKAAESFSDYAQKIYKASAATGLSVQTTETLNLVAEETGKSLDSLATATSRMGVNIDKGLTSRSGEATKALKVLKDSGLDTVSLGTKSLDDQLVAVLGSLEKVENQNDRLRIASALFGRGVFQNTAALDEFANSTKEAQDKLERFGLGLGKDGVDAGHKFYETLKDIGLALEGFSVQVGQKVSPEILKFFTEVSKTLGINAASWREWSEQVGTYLQNVITKEADWVAKNRANMQESATDIGKTAKALSDIYYWFQVIPDKFIIDVGINIKSTADSTAEWVMNQLGGTTVFGPGGVPIVIPATGKAAKDQIKVTTYDQGEIAVPFGSSPAEQKKTQPPPAFPPSGGGKGKKGMDPALAAKELADTHLKEELVGYKDIEDALKDSLSRRFISLEQFTNEARDLEIIRRDAVLASYEAERKQLEARPLRDPQKQKVELEKITLKEIEERQKSGQTVRTLNAAFERDELTRLQAHRQNMLRLHETADALLIAQDKVRADIGITTQEAEAKSEETILKKAYLARKADLDQQILEAKADAALKEKLLDEQHQLRVKYAEDSLRLVFQEIDARKKDAENLIQYAATTRKVYSDIANIQADTLSSELQAIEQSGLHRTAAIKIREQEDIDSTKRVSKERLAVLSDEIAKVKAEYQDELEKAIALEEERKFVNGEKAKSMIEQEKALEAEKIAIEKNTQAKIEEIERKAQQEQLKQWEDISADIANTIQDGFEGGWKNVISDAKKFIADLDRELLKSLLMQVFKPGSPQQGSSTGGIIGAIVNKIFKIGQPQSGEIFGLPTHMGTGYSGTGENIVPAMKHLSGDIVALGAHTIDNIASTVEDVTSTGIDITATDANTAALIENTAMLTALNVTMGVSSGAGSAGAGLGTVISSLFSGLGMAEGGNFGSNEFHVVGEKGPELVYTGPHSGMVIPNNIAFSGAGKGMGGNTYINIAMPPRTNNSRAQAMSDREQAELLASTVRKRLGGS